MGSLSLSLVHCYPSSVSAVCEVPMNTCEFTMTGSFKQHFPHIFALLSAVYITPYAKFLIWLTYPFPLSLVTTQSSPTLTHHLIRPSRPLCLSSVRLIPKSRMPGIYSTSFSRIKNPTLRGEWNGNSGLYSLATLEEGSHIVPKVWLCRFRGFWEASSYLTHDIVALWLQRYSNCDQPGIGVRDLDLTWQYLIPHLAQTLWSSDHVPPKDPEQQLLTGGNLPSNHKAHQREVPTSSCFVSSSQRGWGRIQSCIPIQLLPPEFDFHLFSF